MAQKKDEGLNGNEKIEQAVCQLQQEPTQEQLAHTLTVIRRRMRENGQVVVAVEPNPAGEQMQLRALRTADGASWWYAFTSFEEEMKGAEALQSTFLVELEKLVILEPGKILGADGRHDAVGRDQMLVRQVGAADDEDGLVHNGKVRAARDVIAIFHAAGERGENVDFIFFRHSPILC